MGKRNKKRLEIPELEEIELELERLRGKRNWRRALYSTIGTLIVVAAIAVLVAMLYLPVLRIEGSSMEPNLNDGEIVVAVKSGEFEPGQICCFYYNNKLLLKRVIAVEGDWVEMDEEGYVFVNGARLEEPYVKDRGAGICDIEFPYQVPEGSLFLMGDHRSTSVDSRSSIVGCIPEDEIVGRILLRVWPLWEIGTIR